MLFVIIIPDRTSMPRPKYRPPPLPMLGFVVVTPLSWMFVPPVGESDARARRDAARAPGSYPRLPPVNRKVPELLRHVTPSSDNHPPRRVTPFRPILTAILPDECGVRPDSRRPQDARNKAEIALTHVIPDRCGHSDRSGRGCVSRPESMRTAPAGRDDASPRVTSSLAARPSRRLPRMPRPPWG